MAENTQHEPEEVVVTKQGDALEGHTGTVKGRGVGEATGKEYVVADFGNEEGTHVQAYQTTEVKPKQEAI